ncbi:chaperone modulatory protein CbpM [Limimonas halophila]|uniref:Chaperone modulatory protein CbpM n=1 Tax=Limimonas halophila TaxID=1082479 RepID=A0A1G7PY75_9PROT|nr:chaperone modulator CbpM [Limimonas halophila]SDF90609.1 chaperone modulatory protein CbpM [Limimonas halophila]
MAKTLAEVVAATSVSEAEITAWVEEAWVLPVAESGRWFFDEADEARIALIAQLHHDMGIDAEAMPLVLHLLDQLYSLRAALSEIHAAYRDLSPEHRHILSTRLYRARYGHDPGLR